MNFDKLKILLKITLINFLKYLIKEINTGFENDLNFEIDLN